MTIPQIVIPAVAGLMSGLLLLRRVPGLPAGVPRNSQQEIAVSIVIPARNEEHNLRALLSSLESCGDSVDVVVVDDQSEDSTAAIAQSAGVRVLSSRPLPDGWRGKPWACWQGASAAKQDELLFLDADTYFLRGGCQRLLDAYVAFQGDSVLSVLPFHRMKHWYEQLSMFFNLLMAVGAAGFSGIQNPRMFGQCMMIPKSLYMRAGGHAVVRQEVLENLHFASYVRKAGGSIQTFGGAGTLEMRMFPEGFAQMHASWKKGFTQGAKASSSQVLALSYVYLAGCAYAFTCLFFASAEARKVALLIYVAYAALLALQSRQLGTYRYLTALLYPVPLVFFFSVFAEATLTKARGRDVSWKGRSV